MNEMIIYKESSKSKLIAAYRQYLRDELNIKIEEENARNNSKKRLVNKYTNLKRPEIDSNPISWNKFRRLPKSAIVVHLFMEGCNPDYVSNFVMEKESAAKDLKGAIFCFHSKGKDSKKGFHWCNSKCCESYKHQTYTRFFTKGVKINDSSV